MRVLIIRTSALGDIVHCLPALRLLRRSLPEAIIGWIVEQDYAPLLESDPDLDRLLPVKLRTWRRALHRPATWRSMAASLNEIQNFAADAVLDLMGNHKAGMLAALSSCDRRIGLRYRHRREPSSAIWINEAIDPRGVHAVDRALSVVGALGLEVEHLGFEPRKILPSSVETPPAAEGSYVVIHPGAGWANKAYPPASWGQVARSLRELLGWPVLLSIGLGEETLAAEILEASGAAAAVAPASSLVELVALLRRARLVLGGDTGPTHLAHALGVPTLFIHGPTDPETHGPYRSPEQALWAPLPCSFCHKRFAETKACLLEIRPSQIVERALGLVDPAAGRDRALPHDASSGIDPARRHC